MPVNRHKENRLPRKIELLYEFYTSLFTHGEVFLIVHGNRLPVLQAAMLFGTDTGSDEIMGITQERRFHSWQKLN